MTTDDTEHPPADDRSDTGAGAYSCGINCDSRRLTSEELDPPPTFHPESGETRQDRAVSVGRVPVGDTLLWTCREQSQQNDRREPGWAWLSRRPGWVPQAHDISRRVLERTASPPRLPAVQAAPRMNPRPQGPRLQMELPEAKSEA